MAGKSASDHVEPGANSGIAESSSTSSSRSLTRISATSSAPSRRGDALAGAAKLGAVLDAREVVGELGELVRPAAGDAARRRRGRPSPGRSEPAATASAVSSGHGAPGRASA